MISAVHFFRIRIAFKNSMLMSPHYGPITNCFYISSVYMTSEKRKRKKPTKFEQQVKLVEQVPLAERWWRPWLFEPSHTVAAMVSELPPGGVTEEIWDARLCERLIRSWMSLHKNDKAMSSDVFSK